MVPSPCPDCGKPMPLAPEHQRALKEIGETLLFCSQCRQAYILLRSGRVESVPVYEKREEEETSESRG